MGRPSVADARLRQVLEAAIRVLATNGLAATTLDGIAAEAGMARGHVRHFAGNRDEILTTAAQLLYFGELPDPDATTHAGSFLPAGTTDVSGALDYLFGAFAEPGPENVAALAFVDAARTNDRIRAVVVDAYRSSEAELRALLSGVAPRGGDVVAQPVQQSHRSAPKHASGCGGHGVACCLRHWVPAAAAVVWAGRGKKCGGFVVFFSLPDPPPFLSTGPRPPPRGARRLPTPTTHTDPPPPTRAHPARARTRPVATLHAARPRPLPRRPPARPAPRLPRLGRRPLHP